MSLVITSLQIMSETANSQSTLLPELVQCTDGVLISHRNPRTAFSSAGEGDPPERLLSPAQSVESFTRPVHQPLPHCSSGPIAPAQVPAPTHRHVTSVSLVTEWRCRRGASCRLPKPARVPRIRSGKRMALCAPQALHK